MQISKCSKPSIISECSFNSHYSSLTYMCQKDMNAKPKWLISDAYRWSFIGILVLVTSRLHGAVCRTHVHRHIFMSVIIYTHTAAVLVIYVTLKCKVSVKGERPWTPLASIQRAKPSQFIGLWKKSINMVYQINTLNAVTSSLFLINILCVYMHYIFLQMRFFVTAELYLT